MFQRLESKQAIPHSNENKVSEEKNKKNIPKLKISAKDIDIVLKEYKGKKFHFYQKNSLPMTALENFYDELDRDADLSSIELYQLCKILFCPSSYGVKTEAAFEKLKKKFGNAWPAIKSWSVDGRAVPEDFYAMFENPDYAHQIGEGLKNAHGSCFRKWSGMVPDVVREVIYKYPELALDVAEAFVLLNEKRMRQDVSISLMKKNPKEIHNIAIAWGEYQVPLKLCEKYPKIITPISEIYRILYALLPQDQVVKFIEKYAEAKTENQINAISEAFLMLEKNKLINATHIELIIENGEKAFELASIMVLLKKAILLESSEILNSIYQKIPQIDQNTVEILRKLHESRLLNRKNFDAVLQNLSNNKLILSHLGQALTQEMFDSILTKRASSSPKAGVKLFDLKEMFPLEEKEIGTLALRSV